MINTLLIRLATLSFRNALVGSILVGFLFYRSPYFDDGSRLDLQIQDIQKRLVEQSSLAAESEKALLEVERVRKAVSELEVQFGKIAKQLPNEIVISDVIRSVDLLARSSGVSVKDKEPKGSVRQDFLEVFSLRIRAEGSYSELTSFMYFLGSTERITRVRNFVLSSPNDRSRGGKLLFEGEVQSYRFIEDSVLEKR
ncbi:MAG: type 4a pilus biogenesis protein PilO [Bdellovibrio sp.]